MTSGHNRWSIHNVAVASLAYALGPTSVLFGKHIDKMETDRGKKIRTLLAGLVVDLILSKP